MTLSCSSCEKSWYSSSDEPGVVIGESGVLVLRIFVWVGKICCSFLDNLAVRGTVGLWYAWLSVFVD